MKILLNGESREFPAGTTLIEIIDQLRLGGRRLAVERNGEIVPRSEHPQTVLGEGDRLEIVQAIGGG